MLSIGIIFAAAAAVWCLLLLRQGGLLAGCLLMILLGSVFGYGFIHISVVTLDRAFCGILLLAYIVERYRGRTLGGPITITDGMFLVFLAALTASTLTHDWKYDSAQPMSRLLFLYAMPACVYWVARHAQVSTRQLRWFLIISILFGVYLSLTAIAEVSGLTAVVFPKYIITSPHGEFLGRARGPFLNPAANGMFIVTCLMSTWMAWPLVSQRRRPLLIVCSLLMFVGAAATLTRCVWLGAAAATFLAIWLTFPRQQRIGMTILLATLGVGLAASQWDNLVAFKRDKNVSVVDMANSAKLRPMLAAVAWEMFADHPIQGVGFGHYKQYDKHYISRHDIDMPLNQVRPYVQHNVFLGLLTEVGLLGTIPFLLVLGGWSRNAFRLWTNRSIDFEMRAVSLVFLAFLVNYLANGMFHDVALIPTVNLGLFFLAGLMMSVCQSTRVTQAEELPIRGTFLSQNRPTPLISHAEL